MPYLLALNGTHEGKRVDLRAPKYVLGRHPDCDIIIDSGSVSRYHAQVLNIGREFYLEDLRSRNGTYLNDQLVEGRRQLADGDQLRVCDVSFSFNHDAPVPFQPKQVVEGSSFAAILVDDEGRSAGGSTIMSKLDVTGSKGSVQLKASPEAKLRALVEITSSLGRAISLDAVLPQVLNSLFKIFVQADRGFIVLRDSEGRLIPRWTKVRRGNDDTLRVSKTILNQVMQSKQAILSADAASDARFELSQSIADFRIRSMMCAPLIDGAGESFGALQIDTVDQRSRFQEDDLEVLASVAGQAAVSIDNAQMHEQALRQRSLERDLELAHQVQRGFLPEKPPHIPGYHFFDYYQPANHVGGDYYDYLRLPDGRTAVVIADVVGHGVAAALLMAKLSAEARYFLASSETPAEAITRLNDALVRMHLNDRFITLVVAVLDPRQHMLTIVNAGHNAPLLRLADGSVVETSDQAAGLPLGITDGIPYEQHRVPLAAGELCLLYTDGINEAMNGTGEQYGIERMRQRAASHSESAAQLGRQLVDDVRRWVGERPQADDMCLVCFARGDGRDTGDPGASGIGIGNR